MRATWSWIHFRVLELPLLSHSNSIGVGWRVTKNQNTINGQCRGLFMFLIGQCNIGLTLIVMLAKEGSLYDDDDSANDAAHNRAAAF